MRIRTLQRGWRSLVVFALLCGSLARALPVRAEPDFLDPGFRITWERTDLPTESGAAKRSFIWGPALFVAPDGTRLPRTEPYRDFEGGLRTVQYFEKARMELTTLDRGRVTAGLLVREMISGQLQVGDTATEPYPPATVPIAGDPTNNPAPTYATLAKVATLSPGMNTAADRTGAKIDSILNADGTVSPTNGTAEAVPYGYYVPETKHNIAAPFWTFLTQQGPVIGPDGVATVNGKLFDPPFFAVGLPITEPYWTKAIVGGKSRDVLMQAFERRLLTYTPGNPDAFKVEMGNVGAAYARWRYGPISEPPVTTVEPSNAPTGSLLLFSAQGFTQDETVVLRITFPDGHTVEKPGGTAGSTGTTRPFLETNSKEYPAGAYKAALVGTKSNVQRPGTFTLATPPANGLIVQALPGTGDTLTPYTLYASGLNAGDTISLWVSGPTGAVFNLGGSPTATVSDHGTVQQTLIPKSLGAAQLVGPWAFVIQETNGANPRQGNAPFTVNPPPKATL